MGSLPHISFIDKAHKVSLTKTWMKSKKNYTKWSKNIFRVLHRGKQDKDNPLSISMQKAFGRRSRLTFGRRLSANGNPF